MRAMGRDQEEDDDGGGDGQELVIALDDLPGSAKLETMRLFLGGAMPLEAM